MPTKVRKDDGTYVDADDVAVQGAAVADAAAITATNPTAPAAYAAVVNMTDPVTKAEGEAVSAALAALRTSVAAYELAISALVVDVTAVRTAHQALLAELETSGALTAN